jgi:hypothetical protein
LRLAGGQLIEHVDHAAVGHATSQLAELRGLAAGKPAVLPVLDRLGISPEPEV